MQKSLQLFQDIAKQITKSWLTEKPNIDVWKYAESAHEESNPYKRNVLQWRRLISSVKDPLETFPGEPVDLIGFVQPVINSPEQFILARHVIRCCLADTVPLGLPVYTPKAARFTSNSWLRVQGHFGVEKIHTKSTLVIVPQKIKSIFQPKKVYINGVF
ncbi:TIGR03943 family protein [Gloeocapsopsis sp. IPPAS B-1203]|uniref:TIGR03943 family putative permease subunit n=1 Tax=Gloeocapsopsis sp. IPPAS B-1203 TaxID=2049454 RepID=UPI000C18EDB3|nr:TIGR03943 family protein [Gloeocapsopsis sp. IPPAS B-1203]PIG92542.1 TIGR03943 family protein [Gloeocapsopsis sp. IPPAS B-1203]